MVVEDPWAPAVDGVRPRSPLPTWLAAWAIGVAGPVWVVAGHGSQGRTGASLIAAGSLAWLVALAVPGRVASWSRLVPLVAAASGLGWSVTYSGRTPVVLALLSVAAAWLALDGPGRGRAPLLLSVSAVVAAQALWIRTGSPAWTLAALAMSASLTALDRAGRTGARRADPALRRVAVRLTDLVAVAVVFVVAVPLLFLPAAVSRAWRVVRGASPATGWRRRPVGVAQARSDGSHPFASTPEPIRRGRMIRTALAVVVLVLAVSLGAPRSPEPPPVQVALVPGTPRVLEAPYSELAAFRGASFADRLQAEQLLVDEDFTGRYTTVRDGVRSGVSPPACDCVPVRIWLLGGSAAFGIGQRDDHTIASELVRLGARDDLALDVTNLARPGWTLAQERDEVLRRLAAGEEPPDVIIFYNGFNDTLATVVEAALHGSQPDADAVLDADDVVAYNRDFPPIREPGGPRAAGELMAQRYVRIQDQLRPVLEAEGIRAVHLFQPDAFDTPRHLEEFVRLIDGDTDLVTRSEVARALRAAAGSLEGRVTNLRNLYGDVDAAVFAGTVHTNELGARLAAEAVYRVIGPTLSDLGD